MKQTANRTMFVVADPHSSRVHAKLHIIPEAFVLPEGTVRVDSIAAEGVLAGKGKLTDFIWLREPSGFPHVLMSERVCSYVKQQCNPLLTRVCPVVLQSSRGSSVSPYYFVITSPGYKSVQGYVGGDGPHRIDMTTWNGECLCDEFPPWERKPMLICSEQFIDQYIAGGWTGARFYPVDVELLPRANWDGIDTSTREWRESMYPQATAREEIPSLLAKLYSEEPVDRGVAHMGLIDIKEEDCGLILQEFARSHGPGRARLARIVRVLSRRFDCIPSDVAADAKNAIK